MPRPTGGLISPRLGWQFWLTKESEHFLRGTGWINTRDTQLTPFVRIQTLYDCGCDAACTAKCYTRMYGWQSSFRSACLSRSQSCFFSSCMVSRYLHRCVVVVAALSVPCSFVTRRGSSKYKRKGKELSLPAEATRRMFATVCGMGPTDRRFEHQGTGD